MDKNAETEQYFALWEKPFLVAAEHDHWVRWGKLLRVWLPSIDGVPINLEVVGEFPRGLKNLLVAGRCISSTHEAQSAYRIMPIVCNIGEAAGFAVALANKSDLMPREIDIDELHAVLKKYGGRY